MHRPAAGRLRPGVHLPLTISPPGHARDPQRRTRRSDCSCCCRFQPYRVAGGVTKRTARPGPVRGKWGHDLFDENQQEGPVGGEEYAEEGGMVE